MYAIIDICNQQFRIMEGDVIFTQKLDYKQDEEIEFDKVLFFSDKNTLCGNPYLKNVSIKAKVICHTKGDKIEIFKKKKRKNFQKSQGHRQWYTKILINKIEHKG